jgi:hypothetical protein
MSERQRRHLKRLDFLPTTPELAQSHTPDDQGSVLMTIGAAFSVGPFFAPPTALLLAAALLQLSERGNRWMLAMSWLWLLVGAAALLPFLELLTTLHGLPTTLPTGIPFFGVTVLALVVCEGVHAYHLRRRLPDRRIL